MDHKQAADVLIGMLNNSRLSAEKKEAITTAIGVLAWTSLAKNRIKTLKAKRDKEYKY